MASKFPNQLFKGFNVRKLISPTVVYLNELHLQDESSIVESCAYSSNINLAIRVSDEFKVFYADRYGGEGILRHGGSGRCGFNGHFQIKGIGQTPLLGTLKCGMYSDGDLSLYDSMYETYWGGLLDCVLPWGAFSSVAVIAQSKSLLEINSPSLLVREIPIRLAHFMRAPYYENSNGEGAGVDVERTRVMLRSLPVLMNCLNINYSVNEISKPEFIFKGMCEIAKRYAAQLAFARLTRLLHGSISSSNLGLDGRWLDFGCTLFWTDDMGKHSSFVKMHYKEIEKTLSCLEQICFYIEKYSEEFYGKKLFDLSRTICDFFINFYKNNIINFFKIYGSQDIGHEIIIDINIAIKLIDEFYEGGNFNASNFEIFLKKIKEEVTLICNEKRIETSIKLIIEKKYGIRDGFRDFFLNDACRLKNLKEMGEMLKNETFSI